MTRADVRVPFDGDVTIFGVRPEPGGDLMELVHDFTVPSASGGGVEAADRRREDRALPAWRSRDSQSDGDAFEGGMKIRARSYRDDLQGRRRARREGRGSQSGSVLKARGRDAKGDGGAQATVSASLDGPTVSPMSTSSPEHNVTGRRPSSVAA